MITRVLYVTVLLIFGSQAVYAQVIPTEILTVNVLDSHTEDLIDNAYVKLFREGILIDSGTPDASGVVLFTVEISATGVEEVPSQDAALLPAYPNPFIGTTSIPFSLDGHARITATVHDLLGRQVAFLQEHLPSGTHELQVDLSDQAPGMYFLRLLNGEAVLGTSAFVNSGSGRGQTSASISVRSQVSGALSAPSAAAKALSPYSIDYELEVSKDGYETGKYNISMPEDKDFTARLLVGETNTIGMELIRIPAGTFEMGDISGVGESRERPVHTVTLTRDFYIGKYEVTQAEYLAVTGSNPSYFTGDDRLPVEYLTWYDMVRYTNALSELEGYVPCYDNDGNVIGGGGNPYACEGYRLPMEAEWEYAARAGTTMRYSWGDEDPVCVAGAANGARFDDNNLCNDIGTAPVGAYSPNPWGLYDVHGNVWEWVYDWYFLSYYGSSPSSDPVGPSAGSYRVIRGGWGNNNASSLRSAYRRSFTPTIRFGSFGFRLVRTAQ